MEANAGRIQWRRIKGDDDHYDPGTDPRTGQWDLTIVKSSRDPNYTFSKPNFQSLRISAIFDLGVAAGSRTRVNVGKGKGKEVSKAKVATRASTSKTPQNVPKTTDTRPSTDDLADEQDSPPHSPIARMSHESLCLT